MKVVKKKTKVTKKKVIKRNIQATKNYYMYESNKCEHKRGQILAYWRFKKGSMQDRALGTSYISSDIKRDFKKLLNQTRISAYSKTFIIGSPDHEKVESMSYRYILKLEGEYVLETWKKNVKKKVIREKGRFVTHKTIK